MDKEMDAVVVTASVGGRCTSSILFFLGSHDACCGNLTGLGPRNILRKWKIDLRLCYFKA